MDYIELFDRYMADELSSDERMEFDRRLNADAAFREDFGLYASTVRGVRQEGRQDAFDFGHAMKALTREEFLSAIGPAPTRHIMPKRRRQWVWKAVSATAVIAVIAVVGVGRRISDNRVDNAIIAAADMTAYTRGANEEPVDIRALDNDELKARLPELEADYASASEPDIKADNGERLAMAYIKLHDRKKARLTLEQLISDYTSDPDYSESVAKWQNLLITIK